MPRSPLALAALLALATPVLSVGCSQPFDEDEDDEGDGDGVSDKLLGILVTPEEVLLPVGSELQLKATGLMEGRQTADLTSAVEWSLQDRDVATVSNSLDSEGLLYGVEVGTTRLQAELEGVLSPGVDIIVVDADIERLSVNPSSVTLTEGDEVQMRAYATFSDGSEGEVSSQVRWKIGDGGVATVEDDGMLTAKSEGSTSVQASWEDLDSEEIPVTVEASTGVGTGGGGDDDDQPDLTVSAASGSIDGGYLDLSVTIENTGASSATGFWVDVFVDYSGTPGSSDVGDAYEYIDYLAAEDSDTLTFQIAVSGSSVDVDVLVDTADDIDEPDESDNLFSTSVSGGGGSSDGPDLEITYFDFYADADSIYYYVDVTNSGDEDIEDLFYVDVFLDEYSDPSTPADGDSYQSVSELAAGETTWVDFELENTCYYCYSYVLADSYDYISETDESNNTDGPLTVYY